MQAGEMRIWRRRGPELSDNRAEQFPDTRG
jgi:hypothetical protein